MKRADGMPVYRMLQREDGTLLYLMELEKMYLVTSIHSYYDCRWGLGVVQRSDIFHFHNKLN